MNDKDSLTIDKAYSLFQQDLKGKEFYWSYINYRFNIKGKAIGRYGKGGVFEPYD